MKKLLIVLVLAVAVGLVSYFCYYHQAMASVVVVTPDGTDAELAWLKHEFALTPAQYEKILALHRAYQPVCAGHCSRYMAARQRLETLLKEQKGWSPDEGAALDEIARVRSECHQAMLRYAYTVAACMSPEEGRRYLQMIDTRLLSGDPADMMANPH